MLAPQWRERIQLVSAIDDGGGGASGGAGGIGGSLEGRVCALWAALRSMSALRGPSASKAEAQRPPWSTARMVS